MEDASCAETTRARVGVFRQFFCTIYAAAWNHHARAGDEVDGIDDGESAAMREKINADGTASRAQTAFQLQRIN